MRALVTARPDEPGTWGRGVQDSGFSDLDQVRAFCRSLLSDLVVLANLDDLDGACLMVRGSSASGQEKQLLIEALTKVPVSRLRADVGPDLVLCDSPAAGETGFRSVSTSGSLFRVVDQRRRGVEVNERRDAVFDRKLLPLARTAHDVILYDPYLAEQALRPASLGNHRWMLRRLIQSGVPRIGLISVSVGREIDNQRVAEALRPATAAAKSDQRIRLTLGAASQKEHDRHVRFRYSPSRKSVAVSVGAGVMAFRERLTGTESITEEDESTARHLEDAVCRRVQFEAELYGA